MISYEDLHGERLLMQARGNSPVNDKIRADRHMHTNYHLEHSSADQSLSNALY